MKWLKSRVVEPLVGWLRKHFWDVPRARLIAVWGDIPKGWNPEATIWKGNALGFVLVWVAVHIEMYRLTLGGVAPTLTFLLSFFYIGCVAGHTAFKIVKRHATPEFMSSRPGELFVFVWGCTGFEFWLVDWLSPAYDMQHNFILIFFSILATAMINEISRSIDEGMKKRKKK